MSDSYSETHPDDGVIERKAGGDGALSPHDAARSLAQARYKEQAETQRQANPESAKETPAAPVEAPAQESAGEADAAPPEQEVTGEEQETEPEVPAIDPPRSWKKEARERWNALDRETQEYLVERDREDQAAIKRGLNDTAERTKALTAKEQAAEQARQQYEQSLPVLLQTLQDAQAGEFADIKSLQDVTQLASSDPFRFAQWQAQQMKVAAVQQEIEKSNQRQTAERQSKWHSFTKEQDALFLEKAPELSDPKKAAEIGNSAVSMLKDLGFSDDELGSMWAGDKEVSIRDHRVQLLIRDGVRYREAQAAARKVTAAPKPPVQRPGSTPNRGGDVNAQIQALTKQAEQTRGVRQIELLAAARRLQSQPR